MNRINIDENHYIQISTKNQIGTYCTIIKNDGTEILGGYFENGTPVNKIKEWAETKIKQLGKF
jgi:Icc-related predicted phosphoesterase